MKLALLLWKELASAARSRASIAVLLLAPILSLVLLGSLVSSSLGYASLAASQAKPKVYVEPGSPMGLKAVLGLLALKGYLTLVDEASEADVILSAGKSGIVVETVLQRLSLDELLRAVSVLAGLEEAIRSTSLPLPGAQQLRVSLGVRLGEKTLSLGELQVLAASLGAAAMTAALMVAYAAGIAATTTAQEREERNLEMLLALGADPLAIALAKTIAASLLALLGLASTSIGLVLYLVLISRAAGADLLLAFQELLGTQGAAGLAAGFAALATEMAATGVLAGAYAQNTREASYAAAALTLAASALALAPLISWEATAQLALLAPYTTAAAAIATIAGPQQALQPLHLALQAAYTLLLTALAARGLKNP